MPPVKTAPRRFPRSRRFDCAADIRPPTLFCIFRQVKFHNRLLIRLLFPRKRYCAMGCRLYFHRFDPACAAGGLVKRPETGPAVCGLYVRSGRRTGKHILSRIYRNRRYGGDHILPGSEEKNPKTPGGETAETAFGQEDLSQSAAKIDTAGHARRYL